MSIDTFPRTEVEQGAEVSPEIAQLMERFNVSAPTAETIAPIDDGGIHAGGYLSQERRDPKFTGIADGGDEAWDTARDKGFRGANYDRLSAMMREIKSRDKNGVESFSSHSENGRVLLEQLGLTPEEARAYVVYCLTLAKPVRAHGAEPISPMNANSESPMLILAKGNFTLDGHQRMLEVVTGLDAEGKIIGFSAASRPRTGDDQYDSPAPWMK